MKGSTLFTLLIAVQSPYVQYSTVPPSATEHDDVTTSAILQVRKVAIRRKMHVDFVVRARFLPVSVQLQYSRYQYSCVLSTQHTKHTDAHTK